MHSGRAIGRALGALVQGQQPARDRAWNDLALKEGSPFHTVDFCRALEGTWPGDLLPRHVVVSAEGQIGGVIPAYLYGSCPRLDYVRSVAGVAPADGPILLSHALVGWYGFPLGVTISEKTKAVQEFVSQSEADRATAMFGGMDERDSRTLQVVEGLGFCVKHFHTLMIRTLDRKRDQDPLANLRGRYRRTRGQKVRHAMRAGVVTRLGEPRDYEAIVSLLASVLEYKGVPADVLPVRFVHALLFDRLPGLELLVAVDPNDAPIGVNVNFTWRNRYFVWLGGYRRELLPTHFQSDLLYHDCIRRAITLGCTEIQAGRATYKTKLEFGYKPVRLLAAVRGSTDTQQRQAEAWLGALEQRHLRMYPELTSAWPAASSEG